MRACNRAVASALLLSCLARDFLLSPFFFLFLPLALSFWYWCLQLCSWTAVHNSTHPSFSRATQSARVRGHTRGDWFKVQIASEGIQRRAGGIKVSASEHPVQHVKVVFHPYLGKSRAKIFQLDSCLHSNVSYVFPHIFPVTCQNNFHSSSEWIINGLKNKQAIIHAKLTLIFPSVWIHL